MIADRKVTRLITQSCLIFIIAATASAGDPNCPSPPTPQHLRQQLKEMLGIPAARCDLAPESRGSFEYDGLIVERWLLTSEPGSRIPCLLYRPKNVEGKIPAVVITNGHGESKGSLCNLYAGPLYAKLGLACLLYDTIGEEERHREHGMGTRAHDVKDSDRRATGAGRLMMGKMIFDTMRCIDFLLSRDDVDPQHIGVAGNSLGGAVAKWMLALEPRLKMVIVSGGGFGEFNATPGRSKLCTNIPEQLRSRLCTVPELLSLAAPHCAVVVMNGDADSVMDREGDGVLWQQTRENVAKVAPMFEQKGAPGKIKTWFEPGGGHRSYHLYKDAALWINEHLGTPLQTREQLKSLPSILFEEWCGKYGLEWESCSRGLYWTKLHWRNSNQVDLNIVPFPAQELKCLKPEEIGDPQYTLDGWLDLISKKE